MATTGRLYVIQDSIEGEEAIFNLGLNAEALKAAGYDIKVAVCPDEEAVADAEINSVMMSLILPRIELDDGRRFEGIRSIERFLKDCVLKK